MAVIDITKESFKQEVAAYEGIGQCGADLVVQCLQS